MRLDREIEYKARRKLKTFTSSRCVRIIFGILFAFAWQGGNATTLYVSQSGNGSDGLSWGSAFKSVREGIRAATPDDQIWIKGGTYHETVELKPRISVYGGFSGTETVDQLDLRDWEEHKTILSGTAESDRFLEPMVTGADQTVLDGLILQLGTRGIFCQDASMEVKHCIIRFNISGQGAGVYCDRGKVILEDCVFHRNQSWDGVGAYFTRGSRGVLTNCLFYSHWTGLPINPGSGGIIRSYGEGTVVSVEHCTLGYNQLGEIYEGVSVGAGTSMRIKNSIIIGKNRIYGSGLLRGEMVAIYSRIEGVTGEGNIESDPEFTNSYQLKATSPCIDAATGTTLVLDLDGNPLPVDVLSAPNNPTAFDMGCFEFQLPTADLNQNGKVDSEDLLLFQAAWYEDEE